MKVAENISTKCRNLPRSVPFESFNVVKKKNQNAHHSKNIASELCGLMKNKTDI